MGIRETLNKNSALTTGGTIAIILLALAVVAWEMKPKTVKIVNGYFFSTDDGQTWYVDEMTNNPPYQHDGQEAVLAHIYDCGGKDFCLFLEKLTPDMKATMEDPNHGDVNIDAGSLVKKPGDKDWVGKTTKDGRAIMQLKCPDGTTNGIVNVAPPS